MKKILFSTLLLAASALSATAQNTSSKKSTVYGEAGFGWGQTLFFGDMKQNLSKAFDGGSFKPGVGNNLMVGFYIAPERWRGLGLGSRVKGTFGTSIEGDFGDRYIINYYSVMATAKWYPLSKQFNKGAYTRLSYGFGQFTSKRFNEETNRYQHQYAIGSSVMGGLGYSLPFRKTAISIEAEFEFANRNGTIDGIGTTTFASGQIGGNIILSF